MQKQTGTAKHKRLLSSSIPPVHSVPALNPSLPVCSLPATRLHHPSPRCRERKYSVFEVINTSAVPSSNSAVSQHSTQLHPWWNYGVGGAHLTGTAPTKAVQRPPVVLLVPPPASLLGHAQRCTRCAQQTSAVTWTHLPGWRPPSLGGHTIPALANVQAAGRHSEGRHHHQHP